MVEITSLESLGAQKYMSVHEERDQKGHMNNAYYVISHKYKKNLIDTIPIGTKSLRNVIIFDFFFF